MGERSLGKESNGKPRITNWFPGIDRCEGTDGKKRKKRYIRPARMPRRLYKDWPLKLYCAARSTYRTLMKRFSFWVIDNRANEIIMSECMVSMSNERGIIFVVQLLC